jgi:hypothetical protein
MKWEALLFSKGGDAYLGLWCGGGEKVKCMGENQYARDRVPYVIMGRPIQIIIRVSKVSELFSKQK